jgi:hypothetical protein
MMRDLPKEARNLQTLFSLLSESSEDAQSTFEKMTALS